MRWRSMPWPVHEQLRTSLPIPPLRVLDVLARDKVCEHP